MSTTGEPFASDNEMRRVARLYGLKVTKDRDRQYRPGQWNVIHVITRARVLSGTRAEVAAYIHAYQPGEQRLHILRLIDALMPLAPMIDWPDAREEDDDYIWPQLEDVQRALADFDPHPGWGLRPKPPPVRDDGLLGMFTGGREWMEARMNLGHHLWLGDLAALQEIEDPADRQRAFAEAGRLRFYVDYVLEHRASWGEIAAEEKAIAREAEIIASLRSDAGRHPTEDPAKRIDLADKREAALAERRAKLEARLGIREETRYWWPHIRTAREEIQALERDIVAGYHTEHLTQIRERLAELTSLIAQANLVATDGDVRERQRKMRASERGKQIKDGP